MNRYFHAIIACLFVQASVHGATIEQIDTDHNILKAEIAGDGTRITSATTDDLTPIPEPNATKIISMIGVFILLMKRNRSWA